MTCLQSFCKDLQAELDTISLHKERDFLKQISEIIKLTRKDMIELEVIWLEHYGNNNKPTKSCQNKQT